MFRALTSVDGSVLSTRRSLCLPETFMIRSMTGYGRAEVSGPRLTVWAEAKSLNHRTLDVNLRLPRLFSGFELDARRLIQSSLQRGRVEVTVGLGSATGG